MQVKIYIYIYLLKVVYFRRKTKRVELTVGIKLTTEYIQQIYTNIFLSLDWSFCKKTNVIHKFKCRLGDYISDNNNTYVGLTSTTLSRRLTMHLSDTSSIAQHLKKHSCPTTQPRKILTDNTTILEHQNNKQKLQILEVLHIRNMQPTLNRINFQTSANVLKCLLAIWH